MKHVKQILVTLAFFGLSMSVMAQHPGLGGGNGASGTPYLIDNAAHLKELADYVNGGGGDDTPGKYYKLTADIDLGVAPYNTGAGWNPIGDYSTSSTATAFQGNFDGNGKVVKNLTINRPTKDYVGLFGYIDAGTIKRLGIENCNIVGYSYAGCLAGYNKAPTTMCYTTGQITGNRSYTGGLIGYNFAAPITNCYSTANVSGNFTGNQFSGGLIGINNGSAAVVSYCYASGDVNSTGMDVGGLVAQNTNAGKIINSVAANNSISSSSASAVNRVIGQLIGTSQNNYANSAMTVLAGGSPVSITDGSTTAGTGKTMTELQTQSFYTTAGNWNTAAWDFTTVWKICYDGNSLPIFNGMVCQMYHPDDKEGLRAFLRQPSAVAGKVSAEQVGLTLADTLNWTNSEDWVEKIIDIAWNSDVPKRLVAIAEDDSWIDLAGTMDASKWPKLISLSIQENQISALDVRQNAALWKLNCNGNLLTALDVSQNTGLNQLLCSDNNLSTLDVSNNTQLTWFFCSGNNLTDLDISTNTELEFFFCEDNQLSDLDVSQNTKLKYNVGFSNNHLLLSNLFAIKQQLVANGVLPAYMGIPRFGAQTRPAENVLVGEEIDFTPPQNVLGGTFTQFEVKKGGVAAAISDYDIDDGKLTFGNQGVYTVKMTNSAIGGSAFSPASLTIEYNVAEGAGINNISTDPATVRAYCDLLGRKLPIEPTKGMYIILYDNGTAKKVMR